MATCNQVAIPCTACSPKFSAIGWAAVTLADEIEAPQVLLRALLGGERARVVEAARRPRHRRREDEALARERRAQRLLLECSLHVVVAPDQRPRREAAVEVQPVLEGRLSKVVVKRREQGGKAIIEHADVKRLLLQ